MTGILRRSCEKEERKTETRARSEIERTIPNEVMLQINWTSTGWKCCTSYGTEEMCSLKKQFSSITNRTSNQRHAERQESNPQTYRRNRPTDFHKELPGLPFWFELCLFCLAMLLLLTPPGMHLVDNELRQEEKTSSCSTTFIIMITIKRSWVFFWWFLERSQLFHQFPFSVTGIMNASWLYILFDPKLLTCKAKTNIIIDSKGREHLVQPQCWCNMLYLVGLR